ncbi:hypothetical protein CXIVA_24880 [Clostridium sp. SY8519]|nr:hypothetical protein CXIVA_24880 [Clostridium sp. SY8519]
MDQLKQQLYELQTEVDILKETLNVIKKDPGVDWKDLKNREKVAVIDAMKEKYPLPILLRRMGQACISPFTCQRIFVIQASVPDT